MKFDIFVVRDRVADTYGNPFFMPNTGMAIRTFRDEVNRADANNPLYQHSDDFDLFQCGSFDNETCIFETRAPMQVAIGKELKQVS